MLYNRGTSWGKTQIVVNNNGVCLFNRAIKREFIFKYMYSAH